MTPLRREHGARRRPGSSAAARRRSDPGWQRPFGALLLALAAAGLAGGAYWMLHSHRPATSAAAAATEPANRGPPKVRAPVRQVEARGTERFQFYRMLPKAEVEVPAPGPGSARPGAALPPVETPGTYFLQVGAFATDGEAERMRTRLANLHLRAEIQSVSVDEKTLQRVRIGPIEDLGELNRVRRVLHDSRIEAGLVRADD